MNGELPAESTVLVARGITKSYGTPRGQLDVLRGVDLEVTRGTILAILGASGAGKSTLLNILGTLDRADAGTLTIRGLPTGRWSERELARFRARRLGFVFQFHHLLPEFSAEENVMMPLLIAGQSTGAARARARDALAATGLTERWEHRPAELSGGEAQRVAVARALVLEPAVLLFDEPLSNLDARLRRQMREEIRELQRRLSLTVVYVTHDQSEAMAVSDRIIVMNKATIAQEGAPRELYEQPRDVFVAGFMGDANRVRGVLSRIDDTLGRLALGPLTIELPHRGLSAGEVDVAIRPESIEIHSDGMPGMRGTIRKASYIGGIMEYTVATELGELFAISMAVDRPLPVDSAVAVRLANHGVVPIAAA